LPELSLRPSSAHAAVELYIQTTLNVSCTFGSTACVGAVARFQLQWQAFLQRKGCNLGCIISCMPYSNSVILLCQRWIYNGE